MTNSSDKHGNLQEGYTRREFSEMLRKAFEEYGLPIPTREKAQSNTNELSVRMFSDASLLRGKSKQ